MVKKEVKTDSDVPYVFINGANKEAKEKTIQKLINSGYLAEEPS
jgi:glutaredoxin